jgi:hypothetical protein
MANHRFCGIPACLLLDDKTSTLYCQWQIECNIDTSTTGCISSAFEHYNFITWLQAQGEVTSPVPQNTKWPKPGDVCDYLFHPTQSSICKTCSICRVHICLDFLEVVRAAGMKHERNPDQPMSDKISARKRKSGYIALWNRARIELEITKTDLEYMVAVEATWERKLTDADAKDAYSARKALDRADTEVNYPGHITTEPYLDVSKMKLKSMEPKKMVSFTADTKFEPGRAKPFWDCMSSHYEPGLNACQSSEGWYNSSNYTVSRFNASQCKLYVIKSLEQYRSIQKDLRILATLQHEGQVSLHRLWDEIQGENEGRMAMLERKQGDAFYSSSNTIVIQ